MGIDNGRRICALFILLYPVNPILFAIGLVGWPVVSLSWLKREVMG